MKTPLLERMDRWIDWASPARLLLHPNDWKEAAKITNGSFYYRGLRIYFLRERTLAKA